MLLILTSRDDFAADYLISALLDRELPYFRLNSQDISHASFSASIEVPAERRQLRVAGRQLDLNEVTCVWYRRSIQPIPSSVLKRGERQFVAGELRHLAAGLILDPSILWVNPISQTTEAEFKLLQLRVARSLDIPFPRTTVSNDPSELRAFSRANPNGTICKPIYHGLLMDGSDRYAVYTREIDANLEFDAEQLALCPVLLQARVPKGADIRLTVIGESEFSVEIVGDRTAPVDWRGPDTDVQFRPCALPTSVLTQCRSLLNTLGLRYGAIDLVRTPEDEYYFLEVNPAGEWAWLEHQLGLSMRQAFIDLFYPESKL